ncbi:hypothetical protein GCM10018773_66510 [Streptomyces candidus]|nr:hypothetical protein [Streptomyces candidus]GHH58363.1 hypothetical protein GCM10018773_66510 [Streptomyces candidus]
MKRKTIAAATALTLITMLVFGWSMAMAAMGHAALIASLAPILGLTVQQVHRATKARTTRAAAPRLTAGDR